MLSTQSRTLIHGPGPYTVFPNILSHVYRGRRLRYPEPSVRLLRQRLLPGGTTVFQTRLGYPLSDFTGLGGNVILASEARRSGPDTSLVTVVGNNYVQTSFGPRAPA